MELSRGGRGTADPNPRTPRDLVVRTAQYTRSIHSLSPSVLSCPKSAGSQSSSRQWRRCIHTGWKRPKHQDRDIHRPRDEYMDLLDFKPPIGAPKPASRVNLRDRERSPGSDINDDIGWRPQARGCNACSNLESHFRSLPLCSPSTLPLERRISLQDTIIKTEKDIRCATSRMILPGAHKNEVANRVLSWDLMRVALLRFLEVGATLHLILALRRLKAQQSSKVGVHGYLSRKLSSRRR